MKFLLINDFAEGGGAEKVMSDIIERLHTENHDVTVLCIDDTRKTMEKVFCGKAHCISLRPFSTHCRPGRIFRRINSFYRRIKLLLMKRGIWDCVIAFKEGSAMSIASSFKSCRKYGWVHVDYRLLYWTKYLFPNPATELELMKKFNAIVCVSRTAAESVRAVIGDPGNLQVKYNPLHVNEIQKKSKAPVQTCCHHRPLFVAVGRLDSIKNFDMLITCAAQLLKNYDFELWIIGSGPEERKLSELIKSENATEKIRLLGNKSNPYKYMKQADWFISTSICESYGLAIQEALILNIPVITTRCQAITEVCDERFCIITDNTPETLTQTMQNVLQHPEIREQYHSRIISAYPGNEELYENRIQAITQLWD